MTDIPFVDTVATGQNIDRLRNAAGLSVKDMQMIFGFATPQAIYKWIHGTSMPTIDNLVIVRKSGPEFAGPRMDKVQDS